MVDKLQFRRGPAGSRPIMDVAEPFFDTDTKNFGVGDGTSNPPLILNSTSPSVVDGKIEKKVLPISSGTANIYNVAISNPYLPTSYTDRIVISFRAHQNNTDTVAYFNLNSIGQIPIKLNEGSALTPGHIKQNMTITVMIYNNEAFMLNAPASVGAGEEGGSVIDPLLFDGSATATKTVRWSTSTNLFTVGDGLDLSKGVIGLRGNNSNIVVNGLVTFLGTPFTAGTKYYADGGANAGLLTTTPTGIYVGTAVANNKLLVDVYNVGDGGSTVLPSTAFDTNATAGKTVWYNSVTAKYEPGDSANPSKGVLAVRGNNNDLIINGIYENPSASFTAGLDYYADGGGNAGLLTTSNTTVYVGKAVSTTKLFVNLIDSRTSGTSPATSPGTSANTYSIGDGTSGNKVIRANNADTNKPEIRYNDTANEWQYSNDGTNFTAMGAASTLGNVVVFGDGNAGNKILRANNADTNKPELRYNDSSNVWEFTNDGVTYSTIGTSGGGGGSFTAGAGGAFDTGITNAVAYNVTTSLAAGFTAPNTANRRYIVRSINVANIGTSEDAITCDISYNVGGAAVSLAHTVPVPVGASVELLKKPKIMQPSDILRFQAGNSNNLQVTICYADTPDVNLFGAGVDITSTSATDLRVAGGSNPDIIESVLIVNDNGTDSTTVSITWTNDSNVIQSYIVKDMIIPADSTVEVLESPKFLPSTHKLRVTAADANRVEVTVAGRAKA